MTTYTEWNLWTTLSWEHCILLPQYMPVCLIVSTYLPKSLDFIWNSIFKELKFKSPCNDYRWHIQLSRVTTSLVLLYTVRCLLVSIHVLSCGGAVVHGRTAPVMHSTGALFWTQEAGALRRRAAAADGRQAGVFPLVMSNGHPCWETKVRKKSS